MTRRRFLAFFGGLLAAVTAAFPVLRRPKTGLTVAKLREAKAILEAASPDGAVGLISGDYYEPYVHTFHNGHVVWAERGSNTIHFQKAGNQCGKTNAVRAEMEATFKDMLWYSNRLEL